MSGITGFINKKEKVQNNDEIIQKMANQIIHRGPDGEEYYTDDFISLGCKILSVDLGEDIHSFANEDNSFILFYDGKIYNTIEIKKELEQKGHVFKTDSTKEILVHGYDQYKADLFVKLRGPFAVIIYDTKKKELIGARDHFGSKPFYYYQNKENFMFASEIKSFLVHPNFKKSVNTEALKPFLSFQYSVLDETFFKNVFRLNPGHYFVYKNDKLIIKKYYEIKYEREKLSYDYYKENLRECLDKSVGVHKTNNQEIGSYLSGGIDSSFVVSVAKPNKTFTIGFKFKGFDEIEYAKELSDIFGIKHFKEYVTGDAFFDVLPDVQYYCDEPHANLSTVPLYFLAKLTKKEVNIALSGEGADEMFGGYNEYNEHILIRIYLKVPLILRKGIAKIVKKMSKFKGKNSIIHYGKDIINRHIGHAFIMDEEEANDILAPDIKSTKTISDILKPYYDFVKKEDDMTKKMYVDMHFWLPKDMLLKADKMTMASSLEIRTPLLDKEVWEIAKKIPSKYLVKNNETKYIFRDVAKERIPQSWYKRKKLGIPVPFSIWIKEEKYYNKVRNIMGKSWVKEYFEQEKILKLLDDHYNGLANNGRKIYTIYVFLIWYKRYFIDC